MPCGHCARRDLHCEFHQDPSETPQQARRRRLEGFQQLYDDLSGTDHSKATEIFQRIRAGEDVESLVKHIQHGSVQQDEISYDTKLRRLFLSSLIQSTASLKEVATTASGVLLNSRIVVPPLQAYESLQDRVVTLEKMSSLVSDSNPMAAIEGPSHYAKVTAKTEHIHVLWVPAEPWVEGLNDEAMSHMISFFFSFLNPYWRYVEEEFFLESMRSRDVKSRYCTPLLVNSMVALVSLHSDVCDDILPQEEFPDRGVGYHKEAIRLWNLEDGKASVTSIQALMCLSVGCIMRGKDVLGLQLLNSGTTLNLTLPCPDLVPNTTKADIDYARVRGCAWWTAVHVDLTTKMGLLLGNDTTDWDRTPQLDLLLMDKTERWQGYPLVDTPRDYRPNALFLERCKLTRFLWDAVKILVWDAKRLEGKHLHIEVVDGLAQRMASWYDNLPTDLKFTAKMPPSLYDLHTQYHCMQLTIHERIYAHSFEPLSPRIQDATQTYREVDDALRNELSSKILVFAYHGATTIRCFREQYGLKFMSITQLNHSIMGVFISLNDLHAHPPPTLRSISGGMAEDVRDTPSALEEFFRVLLATSFRWTMSRGFARTAYHTAQTLNVELPETITEMLKIMAGTTWRTSDLEQLDTAVYPNWSLPHASSEQTEGYRMGNMLKQWEDERA